MTHVLTANQKGSLAEKTHSQNWKDKAPEEQRLIKLLALVSAKIHERFRNLREAFRYIDTDHSQSISINEFAQAVDFFRMKLSFEDISKIYRFMDTDGDGEIGFDEFTFLSEERWKSVDAYKQYLEGVNGRELNNAKRDDLTSIASQKSTAKLGSRIDDAEGYAKLEDLSREHLKIPIRKNEKIGFVNINRNDTSNFFER